MARKRYYKKKKTTTTPTIMRELSKPRYQNDVWLKTTQEIAEYREKVLQENNNTCEMTGEPIKRPTLDHCHDTGIVRGVISQHNNTLEGYILKYFNKYVRRNTSLLLPDWLRSLATYYDVDWNRGLHFRTISDAQKSLSYKTKAGICEMISVDFGVDLSPEDYSKPELIDYYTQELINYLEQHYG